LFNNNVKMPEEAAGVMVEEEAGAAVQSQQPLQLPVIQAEAAEERAVPNGAPFKLPRHGH